MRIAIGSAGRRVYLVQWFKEAMRQAGMQGEVYVFDNDTDAPSAAAADDYRKLPRYDENTYRSSLLAVIDEVQPDLFFSVNDYELGQLADGLADIIRERNVIVPCLTWEMHRRVADKYEMYRTLQAADIPTPETAVLSNEDEVASILERSEVVIFKDRMGSASSGLLRLTREEVADQIREGSLFYGHQRKGAALDSIIVQAEVPGNEFGVDIVSSPLGGNVQGVLARRKLRMRNGETSVAVTTDPTSFLSLGENIGDLFGIKGLVDIDIIEQPNGAKKVIDINPRFGGGYPFNHLAGANVPLYYLSEIGGRKVVPAWNLYRTGVRSAKHEGMITFGSKGADSA